MNEKLKPCPFCRGEADAMYTYSVADCKFYIVKCLQCGIETPFKHTEEEAIKTWNTRTLTEDQKRAEEVMQILRESDIALSKYDFKSVLELAKRLRKLKESQEAKS